MSLTQISTAGVKDDAVTAGKLASGVQTTINNNADNRVITGSGTANTLNGESNVVIDGNSNVGIGTTSPASLLNIKGNDTAYSSGIAVGAIFQGEDSAGRKVQLVAPGTLGEAGVGTPTNHIFTLFTGNTEKMRIDTSGDVGIGSSTINLQSSNRTVLNLNGTNEAALCFNRSNTITGFLYADSGEFRIQAEPGAGNLVKIRNNNGTIAQFDDNGLKFNGDTAAANALDDYEEGTWSPVFAPASGSYTAFYSSAAYVRIGKLVTCTASLSVNGSSSPSGEVKISGLPFSVQGLNSTWSGESGHGVGRWFYAGPNHYINLVCDNSDDKIRIHKADGTFLNATNMSDGYNQSQFSFTVTYLTDA